MKWALSAGRYIIILTEIVVISAFFSRFYFDQQMSELTDAVNNKTLILKATAGIEQNFRQVQSRLMGIKKRLDKTVSMGELLESVARVRPVGVSLVSVQMSEDVEGERKMQLRARATNEQDVGTFVRLLANEANSDGIKTWQNIILGSIESVEGIDKVEFILTANY